MTTTETCHYRGYDIVPTRLWSSWCVGIYRTRADLPLRGAIYAEYLCTPDGRGSGRGQAKHRPHPFPSTIGGLSRGTSARIASFFLRRFGALKSPTCPRQAAEPPF